MLKTMSADARYRLFISVLSLLGLGLVIIATSKYGAGVSSDAARNLSTADSLMTGRGFVDMVGSPLVLWPPLYPLLLAALSFATTLSTFTVAWYLNVLLFGLNIWLGGWWLYTLFRQKPYFAAAGSVVLLLSRSMLRIHANVASEPLFETLMLGFLLASSRYLKDGSGRMLWIMCLAAGLATLQRYLGVVLLGVALVIIVRREGWRDSLHGVLILLVSTLPFIAWTLLHTLPTSGTLFGPRQLGAMLPLQNISLSLTKMIWWFVPRLGVLDWMILRPWVPLLAVVTLLVVMNSKRDWANWIRALSSNAVWPGVVFAAAYFLLLAFTVVTADHLDLTSDRYYVVILPIVLALLFISLDSLVLNRLSLRSTPARVGLIALFAIWLVYPLFAMGTYLQQALLQGEPTNYNIANSAHFREMSVVKAAEDILQPAPGAIIYTNYVNIVWFIFDHPVRPLPFQDESLPRDLRIAALHSSYPNWPDTPGYIIWFTPNQYHHIASPDELATMADLQLLFEDKTGQVFAVRRSGE